jgi:Fic family protein
MVTRYILPNSFIRYEQSQIARNLIGAKSAVAALTNIPYQRSWSDALQALELKREVAGTSKIEGAEFTDREFDEAISDEAQEHALSRSQKQARAAIQTYKWIASIPRDRPLSQELIQETHRRIVTGCDDDHCEPGALRGDDYNVIFGRPRHRGASGGQECKEALGKLCSAVAGEFNGHDNILQALAAHYHIGAIHPFGDGNGRTARALEAMLLRRSELKDTVFIAMSNYYYDEKENYLRILSETAAKGHDLTDFFNFSLIGIKIQCERLLKEIKRNISKILFKDVMNTMYGKLKSTKKRVLANRQVKILEFLLSCDRPVSASEIEKQTESEYKSLAAPLKALIRDINLLNSLKAIQVKRIQESKLIGMSAFEISVRLEWPTEITETDFFAEVERMPSAKTRIMV